MKMNMIRRMNIEMNMEMIMIIKMNMKMNMIVKVNMEMNMIIYLNNTYSTHTEYKQHTTKQTTRTKDIQNNQIKTKNNYK